MQGTKIYHTSLTSYDLYIWPTFGMHGRWQLLQREVDAVKNMWKFSQWLSNTQGNLDSGNSTRGSGSPQTTPKGPSLSHAFSKASSVGPAGKLVEPDKPIHQLTDKIFCFVYGELLCLTCSIGFLKPGNDLPASSFSSWYAWYVPTSRTLHLCRMRKDIHGKKYTEQSQVYSFRKYLLAISRTEYLITYEFYDIPPKCDFLQRRILWDGKKPFTYPPCQTSKHLPLKTTQQGHNINSAYYRTKCSNKYCKVLDLFKITASTRHCRQRSIPLIYAWLKVLKSFTSPSQQSVPPSKAFMTRFLKACDLIVQ